MDAVPFRNVSESFQVGEDFEDGVNVLRVHRTCFGRADLPCSDLGAGRLCSEERQLLHREPPDFVVSHPGLLHCLCSDALLNASPAAGKNETDNPVPGCYLHTPAMF